MTRLTATHATSNPNDCLSLFPIVNSVGDWTHSQIRLVPLGDSMPVRVKTTLSPTLKKPGTGTTLGDTSVVGCCYDRAVGIRVMKDAAGLHSRAGGV